MKRLLSLFLAGILLFIAAVHAPCPLTAHAVTMEELEEQVRQLESQIADNQKKLNDLADRKETQQEYLETLQAQITVVEEKADTLETQISTIDEEIRKYDKQLKQLENEISLLTEEVEIAQKEIRATTKAIEDSKTQLQQKLRASYITGNQVQLKILLGANDLASFLTRLEMMKRMSENDRKVIDTFTNQVQTLKDTKAELESKQSTLVERQTQVKETRQLSVSKKNELTAKKKEYTATISQLEGSYSTVSAFIDSIDKTSAAYETYIKKLQAERAAADKEIDDLIRSHMTTTAPTTTAAPSTTAPLTSVTHTTEHIANGDPGLTATTTTAPATTGPTAIASNDSWAWPVGNISCYISSGYGNRSASISGWSFHGGIDIAGGGIYGKPVYASRSGTVIGAIWGTTGYGRYVVIDHGDGYTTVYGHCSNLTVTEGQYVQKGYQIANVGSTGNSTGPHLHFEVRYNNEKQNPLNYVTKP